MGRAVLGATDVALGRDEGHRSTRAAFVASQHAARLMLPNSLYARQNLMWARAQNIGKAYGI